MEGLLDDDPAGGGTALAGGADGPEVDGPQGDVDVALVAHDDGTVATQFQDMAAEALLHQGAHVAATGHRACVGDQGHPGVGVDEVADVAAPADGQAADGGVEPEVPQHLLGDLRAGDGREGGLGGRLPQNGIAADQGDGCVPAPDRHGEVEGRDDAHHAQGVPLLLQAVLAALAGHGEAVELPGQAHGEVADVDHLLDLAQALAQGLAHLQGHQLGQGRLVPAQLIAQGLHHLAPLGRRHLLPGRKGAMAARQDGVELRRGHVHHGGQGGAIDGGPHQLGLAAADPLPGEPARIDFLDAQRLQDCLHEVPPWFICNFFCFN